MRYYQHHIGDFNNATRHLTRIERSIYRDLIEFYYDIEKQLPLDISEICRKIIAVDESTTVERMLNEFFTKTPDGWYHDRCEEEVDRYHNLSKNHWSKKLPQHIRTAIESERNSSKRNATPSWLTKEHRQQIVAIYAESAMLTASTGIKHEVDHIIPIRGNGVCGLHVPWNLRAIPAYKNRQKSNLLEIV